MHKTDDVNDGYMGSGKLIKRAIKKYGIVNFTKEILVVCSSLEEMISKEVEIVTREFVIGNDNYNLTTGGNGGWYWCNSSGKNLYGKNGHKGFGGDNLRSDIVNYMKEIGKYDEYCQHISEGLKRKIAKDGSWWTGRKHKEKTKKKIGETNRIKQKGSNNSQYGTHWMYLTNEKRCVKVKNDEVEKYKRDGWILGRKMFF